MRDEEVKLFAQAPIVRKWQNQDSETKISHQVLIRDVWWESSQKYLFFQWTFNLNYSIVYLYLLYCVLCKISFFFILLGKKALMNFKNYILKTIFRKTYWQFTFIPFLMCVYEIDHSSKII